MFQINDTVMYGNSGVCKIMDIRPEKFGDEEILYYILKPMDDKNSKIYCPVNSDKLKLRKLLSQSEIFEIIQAMPDTEIEWIENDQLRKTKFGEILKSGDHIELVKLIKALYLHKEQQKQTGKKFHAIDEKMMKEAEKMLHSEFAHVLQIKEEDVLAFIMGKLDDAEASSKQEV